MCDAATSPGTPRTPAPPEVPEAARLALTLGYRALLECEAKLKRLGEDPGGWLWAVRRQIREALIPPHPSSPCDSSPASPTTPASPP